MKFKKACMLSQVDLGVGFFSLNIGILRKLVAPSLNFVIFLLCRSVTETFLFAVLLSTFTTLQCLCIMGPNVQAWIRVFSKNG